MKASVIVALLTAVVTLLGCGPVRAAMPGSPDRSSCDLSLFRSIPSDTINTIWKAQRHYDQMHSRSASGTHAQSGSRSSSNPLLASMDELRTLSVPERSILVRAECQLFSAVLRNRTEGILGAAGRKVCETLNFITGRLAQCVTEEDVREDRFSPLLSFLLQRLKDDLETNYSGTHAGKVYAHLMQLVNEHLPCVAKGTGC